MMVMVVERVASMSVSVMLTMTLEYKKLNYVTLMAKIVNMKKNIVRQVLGNIIFGQKTWSETYLLILKIKSQ